MNQESIDFAAKAIENPELLLTEEFAAWYAVEENRQLYLDLKAASDDSLLRNLKNLPDTAAEWQKFRATMNLDTPAEVPEGKRGFRKLRYWTAAASVAVIIGCGAWFLTKEKPQPAKEPHNYVLVEALPEKAEVVTVADAIHGKSQAETPAKWQTTETSRGTDTHLVLADGTEVDLNAESALSYPDAFTGKDRKVYLEGEAYFDVTSDPEHPFIVETPEITTRVLGTEFNVSSYNDVKSAVTVVTGSVEVSDLQSKEKVLVKPGETALTLSGGKLRVEPVNIDRVISWRAGYYYFEDETLEDIMRTLGRWYNVNVEFRDPDPLAYRYNLWVDRSQPISEALDMLTGIGNARFSLSGITVTIQEPAKQDDNDEPTKH